MLLATRKLLIVDDDRKVLRYLSAALATHFDVITTNDPQAVTSMVAYERPAIILCDVQMPGLGGPQLAALLARDPRTTHVPLVFLTAAVDQEPLERYGGRLGGRPAVSKSAEVAEILALLEHVLAKAETPASLPGG
jgi:CheY-like chemotaxis protein